MNITLRNEELSLGPFNKLVKLAARAFYDDIAGSRDRSRKTQGTDNRGIAVVVLDALTRRQWVRDEDLAKDLGIHTTQLRKTLRFLVKEKLIERHDRKETAKGVKFNAAAVAATATADGQPPKLGEETIKLHTLTHSYYCLDYAQIYNVVRYRIHRMKKRLKDELGTRDTIQKYICPNCGKRFNALDAACLVSTEDEYFHCESCNGELVVESDTIANQNLGDGDANAKIRQQNKLRVMLQNMEVQLKPLMEHIAILKDLEVPDFGSLQAWEAKANAAARKEIPNDDAFRSFLGETKVDVSLSDGQARDGDSKSGTAKEPKKKLQIPWMTKQSVNLSDEQRGEEMQESKMEGSSKSIGPSDDKKSAAETDESERLRQEAYYQAYYAALYERQYAKEEEEASSATTSTLIDPSSTRQVGMKSKRKEGDDDEWEDGTPSGNVDELNLQDDAMPSMEDEEDDEDLDWEDG